MLDLDRRLSVSVFTNANDGPAEKLTRAMLTLIDLALDNLAGEGIEMLIVSDTELRTTGDKGFGGYGEVMRYHRTGDGSIEWVRGPSGIRLVPAERFTLPAKVTRPA